MSPTTSSSSSVASSNTSISSSTASRPTPTAGSLFSRPAPAPGINPVPPPLKHPPLSPPSVHTTYTPYVPRARRVKAVSSPNGQQQVPIITSSLQGGVTTRHPLPNGSGSSSSTVTLTSTTAHAHDSGPSAALLDKVRALDHLPRLGALRTLDLKGNDLRVSLCLISNHAFLLKKQERHHIPRSSSQT